MIPEKQNKKNGKGFLLSLVAILLAGVVLRVFVFEIYKVEKNSMNNSFFEGDRVVINKLGRNTVSRNDVVVFRYRNDVFIKRCVGLPGETFRIQQGKVFINSMETGFPPRAVLPDTSLSKPSHGKFVSNIIMLDRFGEYWDNDNFGPYIIPRKGMTIKLTEGNLKLYKNSLESGEELGISIDLNKANLVNSTYTFRNNHYFLLGDNRPESDDSRIFGAVCATQIIGKAGFTF